MLIKKIHLSKNKINALLSIIDQGLISTTNFGITFILARILSVYDFGIYIILFSVWLFINNLQIGFINQGLFVLSQSESKKYKNNMPGVQLIFSTAILMFSTLASIIFSLFYNFNLNLLLIFSVAMFFMTLKEFSRNNALANLRLKTSIIYDFIFACLVLLALIINKNNLNLQYIWIITGLSSGLVVIIDGIIYKHYKNMTLCNTLNTLRINLQFTKWTTLTNIFVWCNGNLYKFIVTGMLGVKTIAAIGATQYITYLLNPILNGLQNYGTITLSKKKLADPRHYKKALLTYSSWVMCLVTVTLLPIILNPTFFLRIFYNEKFISYTMLLQAFSIALIISTYIRIINVDLLVQKKSKTTFVIYIYSTVISSLALFLLIKNMGNSGMIIFILIQACITLALTKYFANKR